MENFNHIMIDIETLDTVETAVILSIAAVRFDIVTGEVEDDLAFYQRIDIQGQLDVGRTISVDTLTWWMRQSDEARNEAFGHERSSLAMALNDLKGMFMSSNKVDEHYVWANSPAFDLTILKHAFRTSEQAFMGVQDGGWPFKYHKELDVRTAMFGMDNLYYEIFNDNIHHPLHDCFYQIKLVCAAMKEQRRVTFP